MLKIPPPSPWVVLFGKLLTPGCSVLDIAAGTGRHTNWFLSHGHPVVAIDNNTQSLERLCKYKDLSIINADLESGYPSNSLPNARYGCVVVANYLHRPLLPWVVASVANGGMLLYETFAAGNEHFGPPSNPDHLLNPGELLETVREQLTVVDYSYGEIQHNRQVVIQRIAAVRGDLVSRLPFKGP